ncbi:hypothetical protein [Caulobacter sp. BE254]|uniref:hypothetical protein n=1 Tax=Caulobacter sp. BE254 TaxID=2817720 RepID=UPI0028667402|nr:hypothetical protein [Caulobacter sp. BE254]MDR7115579.1 hypothetical protein [Caulobacter sp. BE254]
MVGRSRRRCSFLVSASLAGTIAAGWTVVARADVVTSPPDGFAIAEPLGGLSLRRVYGSRPGRVCVFDREPKGCSLQAVSAEWSPRNLPLAVTLERRNTGFVVQFSTLLRTPRGFPACYARQRLADSDASSAARVWASVQSRFETWSQACDVVRALGGDHARSDFLSTRSDMSRAYQVLRAARQLTPSEEGAGLDSFFPDRVTQPLLDAVAIACGGSPGSATLGPDDTIAWRFDQTVPYGPDGSRPFGVCVDDQIKYFPGYRPPD